MSESNVMDSCTNEGGFGFKCNICAFSKKGFIACANPNIWKEDPTDAYYKSKQSDLTAIERESIKLLLTK